MRLTACIKASIHGFDVTRKLLLGLRPLELERGRQQTILHSEWIWGEVHSLDLHEECFETLVNKYDESVANTDPQICTQRFLWVKTTIRRTRAAGETCLEEENTRDTQGHVWAL